MSATFNTAIVSVTDWMRNQLADRQNLTLVNGTLFIVGSPIFEDETYVAYQTMFGTGPSAVIEGLAQLAEALLIQYETQLPSWEQADVAEDYRNRILALKQLIDDLRTGRIQYPFGPQKLGAVTAQIAVGAPVTPWQKLQPDMCRFRPS